MRVRKSGSGVKGEHNVTFLEASLGETGRDGSQGSGGAGVGEAMSLSLRLSGGGWRARQASGPRHVTR